MRRGREEKGGNLRHGGLSFKIGARCGASWRADDSGMTARRALFWLGSATLGALGGFLLGQMTIGEGLYGKLTGAGGAASYAEYSSNPSAATVDRLSPSLPCRNCPDSYASSGAHKSETQSLMRNSYV